MKNLFTYCFIIIFLFFSQLVSAQDSETTASGPDITEKESIPANQVEESIEDLSYEELRASERESKLLEKEAKKESREAKKLERQIQKTKNAEARAIKARRDADEQAEKTKSAIDNYMKE